MAQHDRRSFFRLATVGLASTGATSLVLRAGEQPTPASGDLGDYALAMADEAVIPAGAAFRPTEDNILGPFYRAGAPFRAKITPPLIEGKPLLIRGRVWGQDTRRPLVSAVLDIWQADKNGRYDNDDPNKPPAKGVFVNRARILTDENGYYEYETIHPGRYQIGKDTWRPSHIHYLVQAAGYRKLVTQLYFRGDPMNEKDQFIKDSLIIDLEDVQTDQGVYEAGVFDIVLAKA
jgi:catechol 1,2-dioxygenase